MSINNCKAMCRFWAWPKADRLRRQQAAKELLKKGVVRRLRNTGQLVLTEEAGGQS